MWIGAALALLVAGFGGWKLLQARSALHAHQVALGHEAVAWLSARAAQLGQESAAPGVDVQDQRARLQQMIDQARAAAASGEPERAAAIVEAARREFGDLRK